MTDEGDRGNRGAGLLDALATVSRLQREGIEVLVGGSLSYVPLAPEGRPPQDIDVLVEESSAERIGARFITSRRRWPVPGLPEFLRPRIDIGMLHTGGGKAECLVYVRRDSRARLRLGGGLSIEVPIPVMEEAPVLTWRGVEYRALPAETTFLSKALMNMVKARVGQRRGEQKHVLDMRRVGEVGTWDDVRSTLFAVNLRWFGIRVPFRMWTGRSREEVLAYLQELWEGRVDPADWTPRASGHGRSRDPAVD